VLRSAFADGTSDPRLDALPAVAIAKLRLIQDLEKDLVGIRSGVVLRKRTPKVLKLFNERIVGDKLLFEIARFPGEYR